MTTYKKRTWKNNFIAVIAHHEIMECILYAKHFKKSAVFDMYAPRSSLSLTLVADYADDPDYLFTFKYRSTGVGKFQRVVRPLRLKPKQKPYSFLISDK